MRLPQGFWRWVFAFTLNGLYFAAPWPVTLPGWATLVHWGLGALITVCLLGKLLYDTLFYDRFRP